MILMGGSGSCSRHVLGGFSVTLMSNFPPHTAKEGHAMDIRKPFRRVVTAAGMNPDEVVRRTLRHTAIAHLVQAGVDLPTVKRISRHKTLIIVERYAHQNGEHIETAMDKLNERYRKIG